MSVLDIETGRGCQYCPCSQGQLQTASRLGERRGKYVSQQTRLALDLEQLLVLIQVLRNSKRFPVGMVYHQALC